MLRKLTILSTVLCALSVSGVTAADWATDAGSCYQKGNKALGGGLSIARFGFFGVFDMAFHEVISGGVATGFNIRTIRNYREYKIPIYARAGFHPFNLEALADKIKIRNKLDPYIGLSLGYTIGWARWVGFGTDPDLDLDIGGFWPREYLGVRYYFSPKFFVMFEEGSGLSVINIGAGLVF